MAGGLVQHVQISKEILMYDGNEAGELCHDRANHPMSLVPEKVPNWPKKTSLVPGHFRNP